jgi:hypothetical protein
MVVGMVGKGQGLQMYEIWYGNARCLECRLTWAEGDTLDAQLECWRCGSNLVEFIPFTTDEEDLL